jgi:hypothetical protein
LIGSTRIAFRSYATMSARRAFTQEAAVAHPQTERGQRGQAPVDFLGRQSLFSAALIVI